MQIVKHRQTDKVNSWRLDEYFSKWNLWSIRLTTKLSNIVLTDSDETDIHGVHQGMRQCNI